MAEAIINGKDLTRNILVTVKIKRERRMWLRLTLDCLIFRFGAWVGNVGLKIEDDVNDERAG